MFLPHPTAYRPEVLKQRDPRFDGMVRYMEWASEGFDHKFTASGDGVIVVGSA